MFKIVKSATFERWLNGLRDVRARSRVFARIDRLVFGNPGDVQPVGSAVSELRIDYGPGYRVYFMRRNLTVIVLLCGGDKRTQAKDIKRAIAIAEEWQE